MTKAKREVFRTQLDSIPCIAFNPSIVFVLPWRPVLKRFLVLLAALPLVSSAWAEDAATGATAQTSVASEYATPADSTQKSLSELYATDPSTLAAETTAQAEVKKSYPLTGSVSLGYRFNQANFADVENDNAAFGWQLLSLNGVASYEFIKNISASLALGIDKELTDNYYRAPAGGNSTRSVGQTELRDMTLSLQWSNFATIPVANITFSGGFDVGIPTSDASRAAGLILSLGPSLTMSWAWRGLTTSASISYGYNINSDPTRRIDCERYPDQCRVRGQDLGQPNALHAISSTFAVGYTFFDNPSYGSLSLGASYSLSNGYSAVKFPADEYSSVYAQDDTQAGLGAHSFSINTQWRFLKKTSVGLRMSTMRSLYTSDGKHVTQPFFDTDSDLSHRTSYAVTLTQGF